MGWTPSIAIEERAESRRRSWTATNPIPQRRRRESCACIKTRWAASDRLPESSARELAEELGLSSEALHLDKFQDREKVPGWRERSAVRFLVGIVALGAILSVPLMPLASSDTANCSAIYTARRPKPRGNLTRR